MSHFYTITGEPRYEVPMKTRKGLRPANITDARENGWVPGSTTITNMLDKPALTRWLVNQAVHAVVTAPDVAGESLDAKLERVLEIENQQDSEALTARQRGTDVHDAIASALAGKEFDSKWKPYVQAIIPIVESLGKIVWLEKVVVGEGYAGRADCLLDNGRALALLDWKTCKTLPKKQSWDEHRMQTASYAATIGNTADRSILTGNIYLSTSVPGETALFLQEDWPRWYTNGFKPLLQCWRLINGMEAL